MKLLMTLSVMVAWCLLGVSDGHAHRPSDAYLVLAQAELAEPHAYWDIALRDLDEVYELDDGDGQLRWSELRAREPALLEALARTLQFRRAQQSCRTQLTQLSTIEHSDGVYARIPVQVQCARQTGELEVSYHFMAGVDATHRVLLRARDDAGEQSHVLRAGESFRVSGQRATTAPSALLRDLRSGVSHILAGLDHVLFLIVLLLPTVLRREPSGLVPAAAFRPVAHEVVKLVSAFTIAHCLTLSLSALGLVQAASSVIEPAIAASVVLAAIDNIFPFMPSQRGAPAFVLGLLHGFGFSSALADAGLSEGRLLRALVGFNLGVELGQLCIVALFVPLAFMLRQRAGYRRFALGGGSYVVATVALFWFFDRIQGS